MKKRFITIDYGESNINFVLPEENILPFRVKKRIHPIDNISDKVMEKLESPIDCAGIDKLYSQGMKICIVCDDYTRPTPAWVLIPLLIEKLFSLGAKQRDIKLLVAAGYHREMTEEEKIKKYGKLTCEKIEIIHHRSEDYDNLVNLGNTSTGIPMWVNRLAVEADLLIGIGVIEIHPWAGFAGGCKIISPGVAGKKTIDYTHALPAVADNVEIGEIDRNPFWQSCKEIGLKAGLDIIINVVLNKKNQITGIFIGSPVEAQKKGIKFFKDVNKYIFDEHADIVIVSANPKYQFWGQAIIAGYNATRIVRRGGVRIVVAPCPEGFGDCDEERLFYLESAKKKWGSLDEYWKKMCGEKNSNSRNACAFHRHLRDLQHSSLIFVTSGFSKTVEKFNSLEWTTSLEDAIGIAFSRCGTKAKIAILNKGAMILPSIHPKAD